LVRNFLLNCHSRTDAIGPALQLCACCAQAVSRFSRAVLFEPFLTCLPMILSSSGFRRRHVFIGCDGLLAGLPRCYDVALAFAAVRRQLGGRSGCADGGLRCGCSGGRRLAQHRRQRIRPGAARYAFGDELKPGERRSGGCSRHDQAPVRALLFVVDPRSVGGASGRDLH
jgi:hypothetical protein